MLPLLSWMRQQQALTLRMSIWSKKLFLPWHMAKPLLRLPIAWLRLRTPTKSLWLMAELWLREVRIRNCCNRKVLTRSLSKSANKPRVGGYSKGGLNETSCVRGGLPGNYPCSPKETRYGTLRRCHTYWKMCVRLWSQTRCHDLRQWNRCVENCLNRKLTEWPDRDVLSDETHLTGAKSSLCKKRAR